MSILLELRFERNVSIYKISSFNFLSTNPTKWPNTLFVHFVELALKRLNISKMSLLFPNHFSAKLLDYSLLVNKDQ